MSRRFTHQGLERITVSAGALGSIDGSPVTVIVLWKPNSRVPSGFITGYNVSDAHVWNINPFSDGAMYFGASGFVATTALYSAGDGWRIDALTHAASGGPVTHHQYLFSGGGWTTTGGLGNVGDSAAGPNTYFLLGAFDDDEASDAWFGAIAVYASALTTADITTTGIETALANWMALNPDAAWKFDVDDVVSGALDLTGNGADETSHSATSFDVDEPAGFSYALGGTDATINASTIAAVASVPVAAVRARQSLLTTQTPALPDQTDGGAAGITTATTLVFDEPGNVVGIRFRATTNVNTANTYTAELWRVTDNVSGVLLASKAVSGLVITAGTWNVIEFDTPVAVDELHAYRAAINNNDSAGGKYVASPGFFTAAGLTNGHITAIRGGSVVFGLTLSNGVFAQNSTPGTYPSDQFGEALYFVDVVYQIAGGNTDATVHPSAIAAVASLPAATESAGATVSPAVVAVAATTPAPGASAGSTVTPAVVAAMAAVPGGHVRVGTQLVYTRLGGVLVPTSLRGVVRLDGASVEFG